MIGLIKMAFISSLLRLVVCLGMWLTLDESVVWFLRGLTR